MITAADPYQSGNDQIVTFLINWCSTLTSIDQWESKICTLHLKPMFFVLFFQPLRHKKTSQWMAQVLIGNGMQAELGGVEVQL